MEGPVYGRIRPLMPKRSKNVPKDYIHHKKRTAKIIGGQPNSIGSLEKYV